MLTILRLVLIVIHAYQGAAAAALTVRFCPALGSGERMPLV